jgi:hypothetical protein
MVIRLLEIFARQLSAVANRIAIQDAEAEPPMIRRAKAYIAGHYRDPVDLNEIARVMHVSTFYFWRETSALRALLPRVWQRELCAWQLEPTRRDRIFFSA